MNVFEQFKSNLLNLDRVTITNFWLSESRIRDLIIELNTIQQLFKGLNIDGNIIGRYSRATEFLSNGRKREGTPYTFFDTGEFFRSFDVRSDNNGGFVILADTIKIGNNGRVDIANKYPLLLGLTCEHIKKLGNEIYPLLEEGYLKESQRGL